MSRAVVSANRRHSLCAQLDQANAVVVRVADNEGVFPLDVLYPVGVVELGLANGFAVEETVDLQVPSHEFGLLQGDVDADDARLQSQVDSFSPVLVQSYATRFLDDGLSKRPKFYFISTNC